MSTEHSTLYETWVRTLRTWSRNPLTDLSKLPVLSPESFPPAVYQRFLAHLNDAVNEFMKNWQQSFVSAMGEATDNHHRTVALIGARKGLARRLLLARHPAFPSEIREQLLLQAEQDVRSLQSQLESNLARGQFSKSSSTRPQQEAMLSLIRNNSLTAVLDAGFQLDDTVTDSEIRRAAAESDVEAGGVLVEVALVPLRPRRRIFNEESAGSE